MNAQLASYGTVVFKDGVGDRPENQDTVEDISEWAEGDVITWKGTGDRACKGVLTDVAPVRHNTETHVLLQLTGFRPTQSDADSYIPKIVQEP
jgi:hypothetical protein